MDYLLLWACFVLGYYFLYSWYQFVSMHLACTLGLDLSLEASLSTQRNRRRDFKRESNVESYSSPTRCISNFRCTETIFDSHSQRHIPFNHSQILFISFSTRISSQNIPIRFTYPFSLGIKRFPPMVAQPCPRASFSSGGNFGSSREILVQHLLVKEDDLKLLLELQ